MQVRVLSVALVKQSPTERQNMLWTVILGILLLIAVVAFAAAFTQNKPTTEELARLRRNDEVPVRGLLLLVGSVTAVLALILSLFVCIATVSARSVGVGTAFGKYTQTYSPGITIKGPWESIEEFSTQIQSSEEKVPVSYAGGGGGDITVKVRYLVDANKVQALWAKYKTFERVQTELVAASVRDSVSTVAGGYSPTEARDGTNRRSIAAKIQKDLNTVLSDDGIKLDSVSVVDVNLNAQSQSSIDANVKASADVEKAKTEQERAKIDAETARLRETKGALTPPALQRYCLEITNSWDAKKNGPLPATWSCISQSSDVIVSAK